MKRQPSLHRLLLITLLFLIALAACRKKEQPAPATLVPTAAVVPTTGATAQAPATPAPPAPLPTPTPAPTGLSSAIPPQQISWSPQVVYSSPAPGEEALLDGSITIRFDQPMDQASVESSFNITQAEGGTAVGGSFTWPRPDTLLFTPQSSLARKSKYLVSIAGTALGQNGQPLRSAVTLPVETVGFLAVSQVVPADRTAEVDTDAAITAIFNRPVVPLVATSQQANLPQPLQIAPPVAGKGEWISTSIYRFQPDAPLAGATTYVVNIPADLADVSGAILGNQFSWQFTTVAPAVVSIEPQNRAENIIPTEPITVTFNMPMDRGSVESAISLSPAASLRFNWSDDSRLLGVVPAQPLQLGTLYTFRLGQSARSANGAATLAQPLESRFTTVPFPAVLEVFPANNSVAEPYMQGITVRFASPMDLATLEDRIQISPAPEESDTFYNEYDFSLFVNFDMRRNTEYGITVPGDAADPYGNTLGRDFTWRFTTSPYDPILSLNLPGTVAQISNSYPSNVDVIYRNVSRLDADLYDLGLPMSLIAESYRVYDFVPASPPLASWSAPLSPPLDEAEVYSLPLAGGDVLPTGVYLLRLSAPELGQDLRYWQNQDQLLIVADTNLVIRQFADQVVVWATDLATGQPKGGINVTLYDEAGVAQLSGVTSSDGLVTFDYRSPENYLQTVLAVSNGPGVPGFGAASTNWNSGVGPWTFGLNADYGSEPPLFAYIYTDRPIYRPGDTVYYRGVARQPQFGRYQLPARQEVTVAMASSFNYGEPDLEQTVPVDDAGTFNGSFVIPESADIGDFRLYLRDEFGELGTRSFTVAQYRKPEFLVTATADKAETLRGDSAEVTVQASYLFGAPAPDLHVEWSIFEQPYLPDLGGPFYSFSDVDDSGFYRGPQFGGPQAGGNFLGNFVKSGSGTTDAEGRLVIKVPASLVEELEAGSRQIAVEANVLDITNFPVAARASIIFHAGETYVGLSPDNYVGVVGLENRVNLLTIDWHGQPAPDSQVEVIFYERRWDRRRLLEFGQHVTRWEPIDTEVARTTVRTDQNGKASAAFVPEKGGTYVAKATVTDSGGRTQASSTFFWVADPNFTGWRTDPAERRMELTPDRESYRVGDTARILVQSPFAGPVTGWLTIERGALIEQRLVTLQGSSDVLEIPISAAYAPNVYASLALVKGIDSSNQYADIRLGIAELVVEPEQLQLTLKLTPRQGLYEPRQTAVFDVEVRDYAGNPVQADLSLALVDLAVLSLKGDNAPPIAEAFYSRQPYRSQTGAGLFISGEGLEIEIPTQQFGFGGGGGGPEAATEAASLAVQRTPGEAQAAGEEEIRQDFRDTAYWQASLRTDASGHATVEIPLPDNTTTWRLSSKAVTAGTLVGESSSDIVVTKPLLLRPVTPRFFTVGDALQVGVVVHNNTGQRQEVSVSLEADGLALSGTATQAVALENGASRLVQWPVSVEDVPFVDLTFRATAGTFSDATKPTFGRPPGQLIPVYRYTAEDIVGTSGVLDNAGNLVEAVLLPPGIDNRRGELDIKVSPSLAASLLDALEAVDRLREDQLVCAHGVADQILPNLATFRALQQLGLDQPDLSARLNSLVTEGLAQLADLQKSDGGWGWCYSDTSDPYLSAYILLGLARAQQAGFPVEKNLLNNGLSYLNDRLQAASKLTQPSSANRQAFFLYVLAENGLKVGTELDELFAQGRDLLDPYAQAHMLLAYDLGGQRGNNVAALLADLNDAVLVSATGAHWEDASRDWFNLNSDIRGTAIILDALARVDPQNAMAERAARWLMAARQAGHWSTGQQDAWVIMALADWMAATGELEANFAYAITVNQARLAQDRFSRQSVTEVREYPVAVADLVPADVNFLIFEKDGGAGRFYYTAHLNSFIDTAQVAPASRGMAVERVYTDAACQPDKEECPPLTRIQAGQQVRVQLTLVVPEDRLFVQLEDHFPAGTEAIDPGLATSVSAGQPAITPAAYQRGYWGWWYFNRIEYRDDRVVFLSDFLPGGTYQYTYLLQATLPGQFQVMPALAREQFFPEVFGRSAGMVFEVTP